MSAFDGMREDYERDPLSAARGIVRATLLAACLWLWAFAVFAQDVRILPDPVLTPGVIASTDQAEVCGFVDGLSYSKRHRVTPLAMKDEVRRRYGSAHCGEIDHRLPLALGGADVVENLWCQPGPYEDVWNFRIKDALEVLIWEMTCRQGRMSLAEAQAIFLAPDWRIAFCQYVGGPPCPP